MAIARELVGANLLTYEAYMTEDELMARYDILDGERVFMSNPTTEHQDEVFNLGTAFKRYAMTTGKAKMIIAPRDVLITRTPLRTRQPDVMLLSRERWALNPGPKDPAPLTFAPESVVEIRSPSNTPKYMTAKLSDYRKVDVKECWLLDSERRTVRVQPLTGDQTAIEYAIGDVVRSTVFEDLAVRVDEIFEE